MIGQKLLHYEVVEKIGAGGMGEVYRARDTRLGRDVALKILPDVFAGDPERLARFEREAQLLASLNHTHIASIYGIEQSGDMRFLVLEYVPGEDLAERLSRGAIGVTDAIEIARQISEALEVAHDNGVVHRDLKPANIKVDPDGNVKVLDFGLAKALSNEAGDSISNLSQSPTAMGSGTIEGTILGTAAYMSPEQARGRRVDRRTDVWAFGCVLFEMLTGAQLFTGDTVTDTLAAILREEPPYDSLPGATPQSIRNLLRRCLDRDVRTRLQSIGEARIVLASPGDDDGDVASPGVHSGAGRARLVGGVAGLVAGAVLTFAVMRGMSTNQAVSPPQPVQFEIPLEAGNDLVRLGFDQAGTKIAYVNNGRLLIRYLDEVESREVPGVHDALLCEWSPDGSWIAYSDGSRLYKIRADGTQQIELCVVEGGRITSLAGGIAWLHDGTVVYTTGGGGIYQVSEGGGKSTVLLEPAEGEVDLHAATSLPDDRGLLFVPHKPNRMGELVLYADGKRTDLIVQDEDLMGYAVYCDEHLLYSRQQTRWALWAVPFSVSTREITGEPFVLAPDAYYFAASPNGHVAYTTRAQDEERELVELDATGRVVRTIVETTVGLDWDFSLSPEGDRIAVTLGQQDPDIWIYDVETGARQRFAFGPGTQSKPAWSPAENAIAYVEGRLGESKMLFRNVDDAVTRELPITGISGVQFSPDGKTLMLNLFSVALNRNISYFRFGDEKPTLFYDSSANEYYPGMSPDNRYVAYESGMSGHAEVYIRSFPDGETVWQVSQDGGEQPCWNHDGTQLFFQDETRIMTVDVTLGPPLRIGPPRVLMDDASLVNVLPANTADRFFAVRRVVSETRPRSITVMMNWTQSIERGISGKR